MIFYTFKTHKTQKTNVLIYKDHFLFVILDFPKSIEISQC